MAEKSNSTHLLPFSSRFYGTKASKMVIMAKRLSPFKISWNFLDSDFMPKNLKTRLKCEKKKPCRRNLDSPISRPKKQKIFYDYETKRHNLSLLKSREVILTCFNLRDAGSIKAYFFNLDEQPNASRIHVQLIFWIWMNDYCQFTSM